MRHQPLCPRCPKNGRVGPEQNHKEPYKGYCGQCKAQYQRDRREALRRSAQEASEGTGPTRGMGDKLSAPAVLEAARALGWVTPIGPPQTEEVTDEELRTMVMPKR